MSLDNREFAKNRNLIPLENIRIASPCHADWDRMEGDDRVRFCQSCAKNVYNLSDMTRTQAEQLLTEKNGNLCVQYYLRADGTVLTDNCPVALRAVRRPFKWLAAGLAALLACGAALACGGGSAPSSYEHASSLRWNLAGYLTGLSQRVSTTQAIRGRPSVKGSPAPLPAPTPTPVPTPPPKS